jgi:RNA polymerase sigma factor FliA
MVDAETPLSAAQQALVRSGLEVVRMETSAFALRLRKHLGRDEIEALGHAGLLDAARTYDPEKDEQFARFARYRVRGAILNGYVKEAKEQERIHTLCRMAGCDYLGRRRRYGDALTDADGKAEERVLDHAGGVALTVFAVAAGVDLAGDPEEALARRETYARGLSVLQRLLRKLPPREAEVVSRHYLGGELLKDIGVSLRVSAAGVSRLHDQAIQRLNALMRFEGVTELPPRGDEL